MLHMTEADPEKRSLLARLDQLHEAGGRMVQRPVARAPMPFWDAAQAAGVAGIIGYYEGRTARETLPNGSRLDASIAAAGFGMGFLEFDDAARHHAFAIGMGGLAICAYKCGLAMGQGTARAAPASTPRPTPGREIREKTVTRTVTVSVWEHRTETRRCWTVGPIPEPRSVESNSHRLRALNA